MNTPFASAFAAATLDRNAARQPGRLVRRAAAGCLPIALALAFAVPAVAGERTDDFRLSFDCGAMQRPSQQDTARLLGTHNLSQTYRAREQLMQQVRRDCRRGVRGVVVHAGDTFAPLTELAAAR